MFADPAQRALSIAVWVSCWTAGTAIGPVVGGVLLEWFWWGSVFLLAVPVTVVLLVTAPLFLPESRDPEAGRLDPGSVALSLAAMLPFVYGLKELAESGVRAVPVLAMIGGAAFGLVFLRRQRMLSNPLLNLTLFSNRRFTAVLVIMAVGLVTVGGTYLFLTQYLQAAAGLSPLRAATWLLVGAIANVAGAMVAPVLARRINPGHVVAAGLILAAVGYVLLTGAHPNSGLAMPVAGLILIQAGIGPMVTLGTDLIVGSVPPQAAGAASSISETSTELGVALGIALLGTLGTAVYRNQIDDTVPDDVPADATDAVRENIGAALAAAEHLPAPLDADLLHAARDAFTTGLHVVAGLSALICFTLAAFAARTLRKTPPVHHTAEHTPCRPPTCP
jgi:MFS transporter, DHA2 family, multidrug resistance protein